MNNPIFEKEIVDQTTYKMDPSIIKNFETVPSNKKENQQQNKKVQATHSPVPSLHKVQSNNAEKKVYGVIGLKQVQPTNNNIVSIPSTVTLPPPIATVSTQPNPNTNTPPQKVSGSSFLKKSPPHNTNSDSNVQIKSKQLSPPSQPIQSTVDNSNNTSVISKHKSVDLSKQQQNKDDNTQIGTNQIKALQNQIQQQQIQSQQDTSNIKQENLTTSGSGVKALQQQIQQQQIQSQQSIQSEQPTPSSGGVGIKALQQQINQQQSQQPPTQSKLVDPSLTSSSGGGVKALQQQIQLPKQQIPTQLPPPQASNQEGSQIKSLQQQIQFKKQHRSTSSIDSTILPPPPDDLTSSTNSFTSNTSSFYDSSSTITPSETSSINSSPMVSIDELPPPPTPIASTQKPGAVKDLKSKLNINFQMPGQQPVIKKPQPQQQQESSTSLPSTPSINNIPPQPFSNQLSNSDPITLPPPPSTITIGSQSNRSSVQFSPALLNGVLPPQSVTRERSIHHKKNQSLPDFGFDYSEYQNHQSESTVESESDSEEEDEENSLTFKERKRPKGLRSKDQSTIEWETGTIEFKPNQKPTSDFGLGSSRKSPPDTEKQKDDEKDVNKETKEPKTEKKKVIVNKLKDLKKKAAIVKTLRNVAKKLNVTDGDSKENTTTSSKDKQPVQNTVDNNSNTVIFGLPLEISVERSGKLHPLIPDVVYKCIEYIRENSMKEEGLFRISGSSAAINALKAEFDSGADVDLSLQNDQHVVSGILKLFLRQIPETLFTNAFSEELENLREGGNNTESKNFRIQGCIEILQQLPESNRCILHHLCSLLNNVSFEPLTKMTTVNLAIVFAPSLGCSVEVMSVLIDYYDYIFSQQTYNYNTNDEDNNNNEIIENDLQE